MKKKTSESQRKAIKKYDSKYKRINCRIPPELYQRITETGSSANSVILDALRKYFGVAD